MNKCARRWRDLWDIYILSLPYFSRLESCPPRIERNTLFGSFWSWFRNWLLRLGLNLSVDLAHKWRRLRATCSTCTHLNYPFLDLDLYDNEFVWDLMTDTLSCIWRRMLHCHTLLHALLQEGLFRDKESSSPHFELQPEIPFLIFCYLHRWKSQITIPCCHSRAQHKSPNNSVGSIHQHCRNTGASTAISFPLTIQTIQTVSILYNQKYTLQPCLSDSWATEQLVLLMRCELIVNY